MSFSTKGASRRQESWAFKFVLGLSVAGSMVHAPALAKQNMSMIQAPLVVGNDRGGLLRKRLAEIRALRQQNRPVEIRGSLCYSTCTLFLGLPATCILPHTIFGFHGPSSYGRALDPQTFNQASQLISTFYPRPLDQCYLETARYKIRGLYHIKGQRIIDMGVRSC